MTAPATASPSSPQGLFAGLLLAAALATIALALAAQPSLQRWGLSALTLAILLGIVLGNTLFPQVARVPGPGVDFCKSRLLRLGIVLYGFRLTLHDIASVGIVGVVIAAIMVVSVFALAVWLGTRVLKLDRESAMLIGAGSAICGAAAVMATEPVLRAPAHKVSVAVATVVVFGTLGMLIYPVMYPLLDLTPHAYGVYVGSTVHEVAQVVVAGGAVSQAAADVAVIEKLLRVMMLAPFLFVLSAMQSRTRAADGKRSAIVVPWFAVAFIAVTAFNSLQLLPAAWVRSIQWLDLALLAMAMAALGLRTQIGAIREAGARPLMLALLLFVFLTAGGWVVNDVVTKVAVSWVA